jgi:multiple sugar transport system ATP-binding protein
MAGLRLEGVTKSFGPVEVIHGVDLGIRDGEFVVFVGPSGCGKSTLLRLIAGLEDATSGTIRIGGTDVTRQSPAERGIAMVFQSYALYPHMNVRQNLSFGLENLHIPRSEIAERVANAARMLAIEGYLDRKPRQLSGGQRQRVAIGRAIVREPAVFLFDEPLSNLDAALRVQTRAEISKLHRQLGATMVYVTHDQVEAMTMADRIVVLHDGRVEQFGTPIELFDRPANLFVAGFIGSPRMNLLPGRVTERRRDGCVVELEGGTPFLTGTDPATVSVGTEVVVGVRPAHLLAGGEPASLEMIVDYHENLGSETLIYGRLAAGDTPMIVDAHERLTPAAGETIPLAVPLRHIHVFRKSDGTAVPPLDRLSAEAA